MKPLLSVALLSACLLPAQTPNFSGVWKLNAEKSKMTGPAPTGYLMLIDQQGTTLKETAGITTPRGEQRSMLTFNTNEKPAMNAWRGIPMRTTSAMDGGALVLSSKIADTKPGSMTEKFSLSPDGNTLTVDTASSMNGRDTHQTLVFEKQPDSAADALRKPEQTAGEHYKNLHLLKEIPESQLINTMRYFDLALGVECTHCHVQGNFAADEKPAKLMARKMLTMTHNINESTFNGKMEVRCYTCHKGQVDPQSRPSFGN